MKKISAVLGERFWRVVMTVFVIGSLVSGCATIEETLDGFQDSDTETQESSAENESSSAKKAPVKEAEPEPEPETTLYKPAPGSKFSKVKVGMSYRRVSDLIGDGSDIDTYTTGKAWIPFYYGSDRWRKDVYYKKEGRLVFNSRDDLIEILVDTDEDGYR